MKLSILIPSLTERAELLASLREKLSEQIEIGKFQNQVEVLVLMDDRQKTTGAKRNELLQMATGRYITFVDDDDLVSDNYISLIMEGIENDPDVIGINLTHYVNGELHGRTIHSLAYNAWTNTPMPDGIWRYERCPNHLNPVKREFALKAGFPDLTIGEDKDYSMRLRPMLFTEHLIKEPIYFYMETSK